jgi:hypothetical protein
MRPCIYCGTQLGNTKDHVPPKCVFDFPLPHTTQRITVPCCEECRRAGESDEALYRNLFISTRESERNPIAQKLAAKRDKSFEEDFTQVQAAVAHMVPLRVVTPKGTFVAPGFNLDSPPFHRFVLRMCRALLHKETKCGYVDCTVQKWSVNPPKEWREIFDGAPARVISKEFAYAGIFFPGESVSAWLLNFYEALAFLAVLECKSAESLTISKRLPDSSA